MSVNIADATLSNIVDGLVEAEFQERLDEIAEVFDHPEGLVTKDGSIKAKIVVEIEFAKNLESGTVLVSGSAELRPLKRKKLVRGAFVKNGKVQVDTAVQSDFIHDAEKASVTPIIRKDTK